MRSVLIALFLTLSLYCAGAHAAEAILFGPEWTFTNAQLRRSGEVAGDLVVATRENAKARDRLAKALLRDCASCKLVVRPNRYLSGEPVYEIQFNDTAVVSIDVDPWVVEVNAAPLTRAQYLAHAEFFSRVFSSAESVGLSAHKRISGGHIHIDFASAFGGDQLLARNFIVDLVNHPELAMGALGKDYLNAAPLALLKQAQQAAFERLLKSYDGGRLTFDQWIEAINTEVYASSYDVSNPYPPKKYQAVNLVRAAAGQIMRTIELRFLRPQKTFEDYLLQIQLFESRIAYLKTLTSPIAYLKKNFSDKELAPQQLAGALTSYLDPTDLDPKQYARLLPKKSRPYLKFKTCIDSFSRKTGERSQ